LLSVEDPHKPLREIADPKDQGRLSQRQLHVVNQDGAWRYRRLVQSKIVVTRLPPSFRKSSVISFQLSVITGGKAKADSQSRAPSPEPPTPNPPPFPHGIPVQVFQFIIEGKAHGHERSDNYPLSNCQILSPSRPIVPAQTLLHLPLRVNAYGVFLRGP